MVTIKDVAKKAGVSISTVSFILNGKQSISEETRRRVLSCIKELGFRPNQIARSFKTRFTKTIGILIPSIINPIYPKIVSEIEVAARKEGYNSFLCNYSGSEKDSLGIVYLSQLYDRRIDGVIICNIPVLPPQKHTPEVLRILEHYIQDEIPFVFISDKKEFMSFIEFFKIDLSKYSNLFQLVTIDRARATYKVIKHFIKLGHERIGLVIDYHGNNFANLEKLKGYKQALKDHGLTFDENLICDSPDNPLSAEICFEKLYNQRSPPTAIFCTSDILALGILCGARKRKINIPEDLVVIGFDNIPMASLSSPKLSTVDRPGHKEAQEAFRVLNQIMRGEEVIPNKVVLETELIIRESCPGV